MNNRYLFKAKRIDNGEWIQGVPFEIEGKVVILIKDNEYAIEVDESTICQCTGLKDKNGKLIWENDVVVTQYGKAIIVWDELRWRIKWVDELIWRRDLYYWANDNDFGVEVISNKFDNPEVLESKEINNKETCATCRYRRLIMDCKYKSRTDIPCFLCKRNIDDNRTVMYEPIC